MLDTHAKYSTGPNIWDRVEHDIFANPTDELVQVCRYASNAVKNLFGESVNICSFEGRELVRVDGMEILPHTDRDEGDLTAQLFLDGANPCGMSEEQVWAESNKFGNNVFSLCDPSLLGSEKRLPWEDFYNVWVAPFRGLFIVYPSRLPHYQRPYVGDGKFVQILINMRLQK